MSKNTFIISADGSITGVVASVKNITLAEGQIAIKKADDFAKHDLSLAQLTAIYNNATGKSVNKFSCAKAAAIEKTMAALEAMDVTALVQLDKNEQAKVKTAAAKSTGTGERKVRDSKLQRMAAAFRETDGDGKHKVYTIKQLMEKCGTTDKITHQYISILRAPSDRFVMNIVKDKEAGTFQYQPKPARSSKAAAAAQAAA